MNYLYKYKKYEHKLTGHMVGGRIEKEINKFLTPDLYQDIVLSDDKKLLTFTRILDNAKIRVILSSGYPWAPPLIYVNNNILPDVEYKWNPYSMIINYLPKISPPFPNKNVLILCHNRIVTGTFEPMVLNNHWYGSEGLDLFQKIFNGIQLEGYLSFDTVDLIPGGTYQADAISDDFINANKNKYDLIMVPDCGGQWYKLQKEDDANKTELIRLSINLTLMLKPKGIIVFSKFMSETPCHINERDFPTFSSALEYSLKNNNLNIIKSETSDSEIKYKVFQKT